LEAINIGSLIQRQVRGKKEIQLMMTVLILSKLQIQKVQESFDKSQFMIERTTQMMIL